QPDEGAVVRMRGVSVGYLPQDPLPTPGRTLLDEAMIPPPDLAQAEAELATIEESLGDPDVYNDAKALARALARKEAAMAEYERLGGPRHARRVRELLMQLGIGPEGYDLPSDSLSGGQKKLVALVRLAIESPDVLLLDEPDNHLDLAAKQHL